MERKNLYAFTEELSNSSYPGYISVNANNDMVSVSVRSPGSWNAQSLDLTKDQAKSLADSLLNHVESEYKTQSIKKAANKLMSWKLPDNFCPDCFIRFDSEQARLYNSWPVGTNLLTVEQAESMLNYIFSDISFKVNT